jgi:hypothetical protein
VGYDSSEYKEVTCEHSQQQCLKHLFITNTTKATLVFKASALHGRYRSHPCGETRGSALCPFPRGPLWCQHVRKGCPRSGGVTGPADVCTLAVLVAHCTLSLVGNQQMDMYARWYLLEEVCTPVTGCRFPSNIKGKSEKQDENHWAGHLSAAVSRRSSQVASQRSLGQLPGLRSRVHSPPHGSPSPTDWGYP